MYLMFHVFIVGALCLLTGVDHGIYVKESIMMYFDSQQWFIMNNKF